MMWRQRRARSESREEGRGGGGGLRWWWWWSAAWAMGEEGLEEGGLDLKF
jgi:hypothetical protein